MWCWFCELDRVKNYQEDRRAWGLPGSRSSVIGRPSSWWARPLLWRILEPRERRKGPEQQPAFICLLIQMIHDQLLPSPAASTFLLWWTAHWAVAETAPSSRGLLLWVYFITAIGKGSKATSEISRDPMTARRTYYYSTCCWIFFSHTEYAPVLWMCAKTVSEKLIKPPVSSGSILQYTVEGAVSPPGAASSLLLAWFSSWNVSLKLSLPVAVISVGKATSTNIYSAFKMVQNARADGRNVFPSANLSFSPVVNCFPTSFFSFDFFWTVLWTKKMDKE